MPKVVINKCFGGFGLSHEGVMAYAANKGMTLWYETDDDSKGGYRHYFTQPPEGRDEHTSHFSDDDIPRDDPALVQTVEELGAAANGFCARLGIIEIPDYVQWHIEEYDGQEHIAEDHHTWG